MNQTNQEKILWMASRAACILTASGDFHQSCERAGQYLFNELPFSVRTLRIYITDEKNRTMREQAIFLYGSVQQGHDIIPLYQLPRRITEDRAIVINRSREGTVLLIPLRYERGLVGMLELGLEACPDQDMLTALEQMADTLAVGIQYSLLQNSMRQNEHLLNTITQIGSKLHILQDMETMVRVFAKSIAEYLAFDRVTVFIFKAESRETAYGLCVNARGNEYVLWDIPELPPIADEPAALQYSTGFWLPLKANTRNVGLILVDNLYTQYPIPERTVDLLLLLCDQFASEIENIRLFSDLEKAAQYDDLTGVYNRRMGLNLLQQITDQSNESETSFTLCFLDVNDLKMVNDTLGHEQGDNLIKTAVDVLKECLREKDAVCRMGGDEFLIIFPETGVFQAERIWKGICEQMQQLNQSKRLIFQLSMSHGMVEYNPADPVPPAQLISQADKRMYCEKRKYKESRAIL